MAKAITIFGSTGNLMYKKIIPAIDSLYNQNLIEEDTKIYCIARRDCTLQDYIEDAKNYVKEDVDWERLEEKFTYILFDINDGDHYKKLKSRMEKDAIDDVFFYLAVPPRLFPIISKKISQSKLITKEDENKRIVFEKPFGEDLESAKSINKNLWQYFKEEQIYRIDHYLGKEMIQNILVIRFANKLFASGWNNQSIESISVVAKEKEGVMTRGGYYDTIGALKDMFQSHLLQMMALITMDHPTNFTSSAIKDAKVKMFKQLKIKEDDLFLGQYEGYLNEEKVDSNSTTETFVYLKGYIDNERLKGVPIHFLTGKKLDEKRSEIVVHFKDDKTLLDNFENVKPKNNKLIIRVAPEEGVHFQFNIKESGLENIIKQASLEYCHTCNALTNSPEAYEKLLLDLLNQTKTLFTRWDEIESTWEIVETIKHKHIKPYVYSSYEELISKLKNQCEVDCYDL
ncbi:MAG: glucose-6-phosphate dehydrogenase [Candidatus Izimaplasma sp.]|nr:glucose-6-phosphate dehydrogenase [Candidatus Izimaplasma bacterium]